MTVHKLPPESLGGTEVYTRSLARILAGLGHSVSIFAPTSRLTERAVVVESDGVLVYSVPRPASRDTENPAAQLWHTVRDRAYEASFAECMALTSPDLVHFQHVQGVSAQLIDQALGLPRVVTLHDYWYFCANSQLIRPDRTPCAGPSAGCMNCVDCATARADLSILRTVRPVVAAPLALRNNYLARKLEGVDRLISPSHFLRQQYVAQGFPAERIVVLENGTDIDRLRPTAEVSTGLPNLDGRPRPHYGFLGTLAWQKGAHVLVDAFNRLPPDAGSLSVYGSGDAFPAYAAEVKAAVRNPNIHIHGPVPYDQVGAVLHQFDALIVPSLWYENSPLVIQEARAAGVPVIASRLGALAEKVEDGVTGRLFPPGDAAALAETILSISHAPEDLKRWAGNLTPPPSMTDHAALLVDLYRQLLAAHSRTSA